VPVELLRSLLAEFAKLVADEIKKEMPSSASPQPADRWLTMKEGAKKLKITVAALRQRKHSGQIPEKCYSS
jgi:hypothetical protein